MSLSQSKSTQLYPISVLVFRLIAASASMVVLSLFASALMELTQGFTKKGPEYIEELCIQQAIFGLLIVTGVLFSQQWALVLGICNHVVVLSLVIILLATQDIGGHSWAILWSAPFSITFLLICLNRSFRRSFGNRTFIYNEQPNDAKEKST